MIDLDNTLFNIKIGNRRPEAGDLLVAEPFLGDMYFNHAVITLIDYTPGKKSMGIVMNRTTNYTLGSLVQGFDDEVDVPVFCGGPVSPDRLFYIHRLGDVIPGSQPIGKKLWIGGKYESIIDYINAGNPTEGQIRFFIGYSGWDEGQLEEEIRHNTWAVTNQLTSKKMLTGIDDTYWHKVVRQMGPAYSQWLLHPMFPSSN